MNIFKKFIIICITLPVLGCGGGSSSSNANNTTNDPLPKKISLSVTVTDKFSVKKGEMYKIVAVGVVTPNDSRIALTYTWDKSTFPKPFSEILAENNGNVANAALAGKLEKDFATGATIVDIAPEVEPGGYTIYSVRVGAVGYFIDLASLTAMGGTATTTVTVVK